MEKFVCNCCKYETANQSSFKIHLKTQKHFDKCSASNIDPNLHPEACKETFYVCKCCNKEFKHKTQLSRHQRGCMSNVSHTKGQIKNQILNSQLVVDNVIAKVLMDQNDLLKRQLENKDQIIKNMTSAIEESAKATNESAKATTESIKATSESVKMTKISIGMLKYANTNLTKGKPLERLEYDAAFRLMGIIDSKKGSIENIECAKMCISKHNNKALVEYIGDKILDKYQKKKDDDINIITTDVPRLSMIVLQKVPKDINENEKEWINDKSGRRFIAYILDPLLKAISDMIDQYIDCLVTKHTREDSSKNYVVCNATNEIRQTEFMLANNGRILQRDIKNKKYVTPILKYVAPSFHFDAFKVCECTDEIYDNTSDKLSNKIKEICYDKSFQRKSNDSESDEKPRKVTNYKT